MNPRTTKEQEVQPQCSCKGYPDSESSNAAQVVESRRVLLQAHQLFSHDAAEQSTIQSDIRSAIHDITHQCFSTKKTAIAVIV
jgi:hypothetical protein